MERHYLDGDCQILAAALQKVTGWDVALVTGAGNHVVVATPDGLYLDYAGLHTGAELVAAYETTDQPERIGRIDDLGWLGATPAAGDYHAARELLDRTGLLTEDRADNVNYELDTLRLFG